MGETSPTSATTAAQPNDADRQQLARLLDAIGRDPLSVGGLLLAGLAEHREAEAERQQLEIEAASDEAHRAGYAEGVANGRTVIVAELVEGDGSHDCPAGPTGALRDGRRCPLCDGYGTL